jgi:hypothetical protein
MAEVEEVVSSELLLEEKDTQEYRPFSDPASIDRQKNSPKYYDNLLIATSRGGMLYNF